MANVVITTSGTHSMVVEFNDYSSHVDLLTKKRSYRRSDLVEVELPEALDHVLVVMRDVHEQRQWEVTYDSAYAGSKYFIIDSVEGTAPTSESHLFDLLTALRG